MATVANPLSQIPRSAVQALKPLSVLTLLAAGLAIGAYWLLLLSAEADLVSAKTAYEAERQKHINLVRSRKTQEGALELQKQLETVWQMLPGQKDFAGMAIDLAELARTVRVAIPGMNYTHKEPEEGLPAEASLTFKATGRYRDIYRFIHRLETRKTYLVIERLDAARAKTSGDRGHNEVEFNINVVTFLKPDAGTVDRS